MTVKEIREKETGHLSEELVEKRKHLFDLRSQAVTEKLEDPSQLRKTRKEIAQMQTILRQRELEAQPKQVRAAKVAAEKPAPVKKAAKKTKRTAAAAK
ncbi:MAG: 50S ribosomal protein L29 [Tepidisphaeraceae bacterium]